MNKGFIKVYRKLQTHWLYSNNEYLACWIKILLNVNHSDNTVLLGGQLFDVKRGQSIRSLDQWSEIFGKNWNKSKTRRFFELLKKENMIETVNEQKTTRLNIINFDTYNTQRNDCETMTEQKTTRSRNDCETILTPNKNDKNIKNDKEEQEKNNNAFTSLSFEDFYKINSRNIITEKNIVYPEWIEKSEILKNLIAEHIFVIRVKKKAINTGTGIKELFNNLEKLSGKQFETASDIIKKAITGGWKSYFLPEAVKTFGKTEITPEQKVIVYVNENCEFWKRQDPKKWKTALFDYCETIGFPAYANYSKNLEEGRQITDPIEFRDFILKGA